VGGNKKTETFFPIETLMDPFRGLCRSSEETAEQQHLVQVNKSEKKKEFWVVCRICWIEL